MTPLPDCKLWTSGLCPFAATMKSPLAVTVPWPTNPEGNRTVLFSRGTSIGSIGWRPLTRAKRESFGNCTPTRALLRRQRKINTIGARHHVGRESRLGDARIFRGRHEVGYRHRVRVVGDGDLFHRNADEVGPRFDEVLRSRLEAVVAGG